MKNQPLEMKWFISSASLTDVGMKRSNNEDWIAGYEPDDPEEVQLSGYLYIVADGVGGASRGERASQYAAQKVLYEYFQYPDTPPEERLKVLLRRAGNEIHQFAIDNGTSKMATTMVAAVIRGDKLTIANVGDSRGYLIRNGQIIQISRDHNLADEMVRNGSITVEEAKHSKIKNKLTRSLGGEHDVKVDIFKDIELLPGDLIILCSDGLTRYATDDDLLNLSAEGTLDEICHRMITFAKQSGGADNISVYLMKISASLEEKLSSSHGQVPQPVDWDTMQTQSGNILINPIRKKKTKKIKPIIYLSMIAMMVIVIVGGSILLSVTGKWNYLLTVETVTSTEIFMIIPENTEIVSTPLETPSPVIELVVTESILESVTPTEEDVYIVATPETSGLFTCIHIVQSGESISIIFSKYTPPPPTTGIYYRFLDCDLEMNTCTGPEQLIEDPNLIPPGDLLEIPDIVEDNCNDENSSWVEIINP